VEYWWNGVWTSNIGHPVIGNQSSVIGNR